VDHKIHWWGLKKLSVIFVFCYVITVDMLTQVCKTTHKNVLYLPPIVKVRAEVDLSLCLTKHHALKTYWGSGRIDPQVFNLGTRGEGSASGLRRFIPERRVPGTHWIRGCVDGPQGRSGRSGDVRKFHHCPSRELNPGRPYNDWATLTPLTKVQNEITVAYKQICSCGEFCWPPYNYVHQKLRGYVHRK
jgi:hypothetical protein